MMAPRWFYIFIAACVGVLTLSASAALVSLTYRLRYTTDPEHGALVDHWHRTYCLTGGCVPFDDSTSADSTFITPRDFTPLAPRKPLGLDSMVRPRSDLR